MGRILDVNQIVQQLVEGGHPSASEVRSCQDHLNSRWEAIAPDQGALGQVQKISSGTGAPTAPLLGVLPACLPASVGRLAPVVSWTQSRQKKAPPHRPVSLERAPGLSLDRRGHGCQ